MNKPLAKRINTIAKEDQRIRKSGISFDTRVDQKNAREYNSSFKKNKKGRVFKKIIAL